MFFIEPILISGGLVEVVILTGDREQETPLAPKFLGFMHNTLRSLVDLIC